MTHPDPAHHPDERPDAASDLVRIFQIIGYNTFHPAQPIEITLRGDGAASVHFAWGTTDYAVGSPEAALLATLSPSSPAALAANRDGPRAARAARGAHSSSIRTSASRI